MWKGDSCAIYLRAQSVWVSDGVHHPSCLPGAPKPVSRRSWPHRALDPHNLWVALTFVFVGKLSKWIWKTLTLYCVGHVHNVVQQANLFPCRILNWSSNWAKTYTGSYSEQPITLSKWCKLKQNKNEWQLSCIIWRFSVLTSCCEENSAVQLHSPFRRRAGLQQEQGNNKFIWVNCSCEVYVLRINKWWIHGWEWCILHCTAPHFLWTNYR